MAKKSVHYTETRRPIRDIWTRKPIGTRVRRTYK